MWCMQNHGYERLDAMFSVTIDRTQFWELNGTTHLNNS